MSLPVVSGEWVDPDPGSPTLTASLTPTPNPRLSTLNVFLAAGDCSTRGLLALALSGEPSGKPLGKPRGGLPSYSTDTLSGKKDCIAA